MWSLLVNDDEKDMEENVILTTVVGQQAMTMMTRAATRCDQNFVKDQACLTLGIVLRYVL